MGRPKSAAKKVVPANKLEAALSQRLPLHLLLADDNVVNQKVALRLFDQMGYRIDIAGDGLEALEALERKRYDIVFMDVQMPEMDGLEATRRIRESERALARDPNATPPLIIIAMTANAMTGDREKCLKAGMDDYLAKPVRPEAVQAALKRWGPVAKNPAARSGPAGVPPESARPPVADPPRAMRSLPPEVQEPVEPPVDIERLAEMAGGDEAGISELIELYFAQTSNQFEQLRAAVEANAHQEVERVAHKAAGASATCGMNAVVPALRELERQGHEGRLIEATALVAHTLKELERIRAYLNNRQLFRRTSTGASPT
jgi:CheY-like chemotaxis protein/HPt (histidine-containing phosphotransfer) domain-containing protein